MCVIIIVGQGVAQVIISIQEELNMENCKLLDLKNMKTMMKKTTQYWGVSTKFFDSGKVKANIFPVESATKPESMKEVPIWNGSSVRTNCGLL